MRTHNRGRVEVLADKAYELVFEDGDPPVNILTRDYAREIIERRVHLDSSVPYELEKVRPPYGSEWPDEIPSMGDLEKEYESDGTRFGGGLGRVLGSVTADDFARYVIGADSHSFEWSSRRLDEPDRPSYEERFEDFKEGLSEEQLQGLSELQRAKSFSPVRLVELISEELDGEDFTKEDLDKEIDELRKILRGSLSEEEQDTFDEFVWPYIENPQIDGQKNEFDVSLIQRFVLEKVLDLGYTDDRFEEFDERAVDHRRYGRSGEKPERIGKKYQWIVYYEALARIADNFRFLGDVWSDEEKDYQGPWQLSKIRNIDPSVVNDDPQTSFHLDPNSCWWFDATYDWSLDDELKNWLHDDENVPRAGPRLQVTRESDGTEWLVLHGHFGWYESSAPEEKSRDAIRRQVWYFANSFILPEEEKAESFEWSQGYDFTQHDWMMESLSRPKEVHVGYCYLGELYWSPCYRSQFLFESPNGSNDASEESWRQTTEDFLWERIYDCSGEESVNVDVPAFELAERMGLKWATMGRFKDSSGKIVAMDPSFEQSGPSMLLIREDEFLTFLEENNLSVIWTINGEKLIAGGGEPVMFDDRMYITGAYTLDKEGSVIGGMSYDIRV
jgi:hypothetical protein